MTEKIYEKQSYLRECTAVVTECMEENGKVYIKLDKTIFFPEEGGQYADTGSLTAGDRIVRILGGELLGSASETEPDIRYIADGKIEVGTDVLCKLDWNVRFDRMQNHSGEHILSGLIHSRYGYNNVGFHLSDDEPVTLALDGVLEPEQVRELEKEANKIIYANLPITDSYPSKKELETIDYRSKIEIKGQVRLITIGEGEDTVDICACCAPHVAYTGSIGIIKILSAVRFKGGTQLSILCGRRALEYIVHSIDNLNDVARGFSTHPDNVPKLVAGLKEENAELTAKVATLTENAIIDNVKSGLYNRCVFTDMDLSAANMKNIYNALTELRSGYVGLFVGDDERGYRYYCGGNGLDAGALGMKMREELGAKGGGSSDMIQGKTGAVREEIEAFWKKQI